MVPENELTRGRDGLSGKWSVGFSSGHVEPSEEYAAFIAGLEQSKQNEWQNEGHLLPPPLPRLQGDVSSSLFWAASPLFNVHCFIVLFHVRKVKVTRDFIFIFCFEKSINTFYIL
jgi:hypothetical protein